MYSLTEIAKIFSVTRQTVRNWVLKGYIKGIKIGNQYRVEKSEVERLKRGE